MKRVEVESFLKSFLLFFVSLAVLSAILFYTLYKKEQAALDVHVFTQMKLCSFDLNCTGYGIDFVPLEQAELFSLKRNTQELYALFSIPDSQIYALKISLATEAYDQMLQTLQKTFIWQYVWVMIAIVFIAALFSIYTLHPLRKALRMTEEFVKDILHDFNTPLSSLRLNASMIKCPRTEAKKLERIEHAVASILSLQSNLRSYLMEHAHTRERFDIRQILQERIDVTAKLYPSLSFKFAGDTMLAEANKDAFSRIIDNVLSNAAKYNKQKGRVDVRLNRDTITISDTGIGIEHPKRVFERFYKEHERGMGIGLHSVKKLCDEMKINIAIDSVPGEGTQVRLDVTSILFGSTTGVT